MRLHRGVPVLAAVATLAGAAAPTAYGFQPTAGPGTDPGQPVAALVQHRPASSTDWVLIGVASAGAITLAGAGLSASRRCARSGPPSRGGRPASGC
jgi:hypothetical protein